MRALSAYDVLRIWEKGQEKHALDRAMLLLAPAFPELSSGDLRSLSIGQRNLRLLMLREGTLGPTLKAYVECPRCGDPLEFEMNARDLRVAELREGSEERFQLRSGEYELEFRLLTTADLASVLGRPGVGAARRELTRRALLGVRRDGADVPNDELPESLITALAEQLSECDPQAEVRFNLNCPACDHGWRAGFDIVSFFWAELAALAERLMDDVHRLARAYGWRETDILAMSAARRHAYLGRL